MNTAAFAAVFFFVRPMFADSVTRSTTLSIRR